MSAPSYARAWLAVGTSIAMALASAGNAQAAPGDATLAEALFREGQQLLSSGKTHEACEKLAASEKLDPALGTLLNLAACHETEGRTATAWGEFSEAAGIADKRGEKKRVAFAAGHVRSLEAKLSRIRLVVSASSGVDAVTVDGAALDRAAWDVPLPVDPGDHVFGFSGPHKRSTSVHVAAAAGPALATVEAPRLVDEAPPPPAAAPAAVAPSDATKKEAPSDTGSDTRVLGFVVGGAGVAALGVGTVFGLMTLSEKSDASGHCNASAVCDPTGYQSGQDAYRSATISTVTFGVGLAATAVGVWLVLRSSHADSSPAAVGVAPGGLVLRGRF